MKSVLKLLIFVSIILVFLAPGASIMVQAQTDNAPECVLTAVRYFRLSVAPGASIEIQQGEQFVGKLWPNIARIKINGVWYEVARNNVTLVSWNVPEKMSEIDTSKKRLSSSDWEQIKTAHASGIGLREIARNIGIPQGTVLARAKREGWTKEIKDAKALAKREDTVKAITPFEAASATMQQRGERHLGRMANIVEKTMPHVEAMEPGAILDRVDDVEKLDKVARRTFGISDDDVHGSNVLVNIAILGL